MNATLEDAINDPFFGEREAIALSYGENGSPTNEETTSHDAMSDAQPIALEPLTVPDTDLEGVDADKVFNVTAADVVGYLGLNSSGQSDTDFYSFTAQAGTLINFQLMSVALTRSWRLPALRRQTTTRGRSTPIWSSTTRAARSSSTMITRSRMPIPRSST